MEMLGQGTGLLGLPAREVWAMTPRELAAALSARFGPPAAPMDRAALDTLMRRYPDGRRPADKELADARQDA